MQAHTLQVSRTAHYYTLGAPSPAIRQVWIVCHGYGQLAQYFLRRFSMLDDGHTLVVAPEGLSRFYLSGTSGRVGSSWMTRHERQTEITDHAAYLDRLAQHLLHDLPADVKLFVLGFSQGVATVCRWLANSALKPNALVLWAGVFPPDLEPDAVYRSLKDVPVLLVAGRQDEYITEEAATQLLNQLNQQGLTTDLRWYDGGHTIDPQLMHAIHRQLTLA